MKTEAFHDRVRQVEQMAEDSRTALMCTEADPLRCHRTPLGVPETGQQGSEHHPPDERRPAGEPRRDYGKAPGTVETPP